MAILLVLIWHYLVCIGAAKFDSPGGLAKVFFSLTWSGVDLFFVLSGFLIGGILLDNKGAANYFQTFYIRRACRIFPLYYTWLLLTLTLAYLLSGPSVFSNFPFAAYLTYTQNFYFAMHGNLEPGWLGITWSLAAEEQFYLLFPLFIYLLPRRYIPPALIFLIIAAPVLRVFLFNASQPQGFYSLVMMPCRMDALLLGALAACIYRHERLREAFAKNLALVYGILLIMAVLLMDLAFKIKIRSFLLVNLVSFDMTLTGFSMLAVFYFLILLVAVTEKKGPVSFVARNIYLQRLGIISYGVYILHQTVLDLVHKIVLGQSPVIRGIVDLAVTFLALVLTVTIAQVSWMCYEKKIVAWGHRFQYRHANGKGA